MSDFVEQCRSEWRRLGVPDRLANEMAVELSSDLEDAQAEGVSAEEFLGSDPRSFAASWAAERGIVPAPARSAGRRPIVLVAFTAFAAIAALVAALLLATGEPKVSLTTFTKTPPRASLPHAVSGHVVSTSASTPVEWILLVLAIVALGFAAWLWSRWSRSRPSVAAA